MPMQRGEVKDDMQINNTRIRRHVKKTIGTKKKRELLDRVRAPARGGSSHVAARSVYASTCWTEDISRLDRHKRCHIAGSSRGRESNSQEAPQTASIYVYIFQFERNNPRSSSLCNRSRLVHWGYTSSICVSQVYSCIHS
jgi:hypothetical protein